MLSSLADILKETEYYSPNLFCSYRKERDEEEEELMHFKTKMGNNNDNFYLYSTIQSNRCNCSVALCKE